jgi:predicted DNA-binding transcriptional regulator AlpA
MRREFQQLTTVDEKLIPEVLGELAELKAQLTQRLLATREVRDQLLTAEDVASRLSVSTQFVYAHAGELGGCRLSERALRFRQSDVDRFVQRMSN